MLRGLCQGVRGGSRLGRLETVLGLLWEAVALPVSLLLGFLLQIRVSPLSQLLQLIQILVHFLLVKLNSNFLKIKLKPHADFLC